MRRREFITLLGSAVTARPLAAQAQQLAMPVIGYFSGRSPEAEAPHRCSLSKPGLKRQFDKAFAMMAERNIAAILYGANLFAQVISERLVELAARYRIPALYEWREFVTAGGLMSYSTDRNEVGREAGLYAGRILKGEKPADLPVVQSSRFEFVINLKTAKALGLDLPLHLLQHADEVIE